LKKSQKNQKNTNISTLKEVLFLWAKTAHEPQLPTISTETGFYYQVHYISVARLFTEEKAPACGQAL
jgi:hypothetical protein